MKEKIVKTTYEPYTPRTGEEQRNIFSFGLPTGQITFRHEDEVTQFSDREFRDFKRAADYAIKKGFDTILKRNYKQYLDRKNHYRLIVETVDDLELDGTPRYLCEI